MASRRSQSIGEGSTLSAASNLKYSIKAEEGSRWAGLGWAGLAGLGVEAGQRPAKYFKWREEDEFQCCQLELHCHHSLHLHLGCSRSTQSSRSDQRKRVNPLEFLQNMWQMLCGFIDVIYINSLNLCKKRTKSAQSWQNQCKKKADSDGAVS